MALKSGSLGTLLQGVSQQSARVRLPGQVSEQNNLVSDVTLGLSTRPATEEIGYLAGGTPDHSFREVSLDGAEYTLGYKEGDLRVWQSGTAIPVVYREGADADYIGSDMRFHVVDKKVVILNRDITVADAELDVSNTWYSVLFHALGGQFLKTYAVQIDFSDGTVINAEYTAPDGTNNGDAAETASEYIVEQLVDALLVHPDLPVDTVINRQYDVAQVYHPTLSMTIGVSDGEGGEILRGVSTTVKDITDLPRFAPNGMVIKVVTSEADEDDFWLKFVTDTELPEDGLSGLGTEGVWEEWYDPSQKREFDLTTMPHTMVFEDGIMYVEFGPWLGRSVGDEDSAPFASILGSTIRDINGFESRLALLSRSTVVMSRTNEPFDLWRESATVVSATDPIDITSTKKDDLILDWFVPFDRDLFIVADPGDSQFVIRGGGIDPSSASMVLTTEFEISSGGASPTSTGRTILFPFKAGKYSGIKEFYTDSDNAANAANSLTETQDRYIVGNVTCMQVSQNFNMGLFLTDGDSNTVWVYKYLWDGNEVLQSAWSKWSFPDKVHYLFFDGSKVNLISSSGGDVFVHQLDLNRPTGDFGFHEMLDRKITRTVTGSSVELPYKDARLLQSTGCAYPGLETLAVSVTKIRADAYRYELSPSVVPVGAKLICGQSVEWSLEPSEVFAVDYQGRVDTSKKVTIQDYVVHVDNSGEFSAAGTSPYGDDWEFTVQMFPLDNEAGEVTDMLTYTGPSTVPWGERADWSTLTLKGHDIRPVTILELEWVGQILSTKGRRA